MDYKITTSTGTQIKRTLARDTYRRHLVTSINNTINAIPASAFSYTYDNINRVTKRNTDTFGYNSRSEVTSANIASNAYTYNYDAIGNNLQTSQHSVPTSYSPNALNQYTSVNTIPFTYDLDGNFFPMVILFMRMM